MEVGAGAGADRGRGSCPPPHFIYVSDFLWKSPGKGKVYPLQEDTSHGNVGGAYTDVHLRSLIRTSQSLVKILSENSVEFGLGCCSLIKTKIQVTN